MNSREQENLRRQIAKSCIEYGIPLGSPMAGMGAKAGTVNLPGVGTLSGAAVGFLDGLLGGGGMCVMVNLGANEQVQKELKKWSDRWSISLNR